MKSKTRSKTPPAPTPRTPSREGIRTILVPLDFSDASRKALVYASWFAGQFGARLTLLHVIEPAGTPAFDKTSPAMPEREIVLERCRTELESIVEQEGIKPKLVERIDIRFGRSYGEIVDTARMLNIDLIIISTHGYTGWKRTIFGSTTERVVQQAPCPVLVVREHEKEFVPTLAKPAAKP